VAESYRLWLQYETRTDDITVIVVHVNGLTEVGGLDLLLTSILKLSFSSSLFLNSSIFFSSYLFSIVRVLLVNLQ
jgi:hypothetical protein